MQLAKRVFLVAGGMGFLLVLPAYFVESFSAKLNPPAIEHPDFYYGFVGVVAVWQLVYWLIGTDPARYRPMMLPAALAKGSFVATLLALFAAGRANTIWVGFAVFDGTFSVLFLIAYVRTGKGLTTWNEESRVADGETARSTWRQR